MAAALPGQMVADLLRMGQVRAVVGMLCGSTRGEGLQVILTAGPCPVVGVPCVSALRRLVMAAGPVHGGWLSARGRACRYHRCGDGARVVCRSGYGAGRLIVKSVSRGPGGQRVWCVPPSCCVRGTSR